MSIRIDLESTPSVIILIGRGGMQNIGKDFAAVIGDAAKVLPPKRRREAESAEGPGT